MNHRIAIELAPYPPSDEHRVRNFVEAVIVGAWEAGWVENLDALDKNVRDLRVVSFDFPARQSDEAVKMVGELVASHFMRDGVTVRHQKKGQPSA